jgi:hypothetical protein
MRKIKEFGKGGEPIPSIVDRFEKIEPVVEKEETFTPEKIEEDESLIGQLPTPTGYRIMILPFSRKHLQRRTQIPCGSLV